MPRPPIGLVGRSAGAAEHHVAKHRIVISLSRTTSRTRATALGCVLALAFTCAPSAAGAQSASDSISGTRRAIEATANQWFGAQRHAADLDREIETLTKAVADAHRQLTAIRRVANARAVQIYESGTQSLNPMVGSDPLALGRRAALIGQANARGQHAIDELNAKVADLTARREQLHAARDAQARAIRDLTSRRRALDAELAALQLRSARAAHTVLARASRRLAEPAVATRSAGRSAARAARHSLPTPGSASPPSDTGAVSPHHDEPFLVCTRTRESGGVYTAISPSGYYGAYQFSPTTWSVAATHAGRLDLVGVRASSAPAYDQDELAWSLYQWQGNTPWGGRC